MINIMNYIIWLIGILLIGSLIFLIYKSGKAEKLNSIDLSSISNKFKPHQELLSYPPGTPIIELIPLTIAIVTLAGCITFFTEKEKKENLDMMKK